jgi:hypothetical protein
MARHANGVADSKIPRDHILLNKFDVAGRQVGVILLLSLARISEGSTPSATGCDGGADY